MERKEQWKSIVFLVICTIAVKCFLHIQKQTQQEELKVKSSCFLSRGEQLEEDAGRWDIQHLRDSHC